MFLADVCASVAKQELTHLKTLCTFCSVTGKLGSSGPPKLGTKHTADGGYPGGDSCEPTELLACARHVVKYLAEARKSHNRAQSQVLATVH
eukprot:4092989-Pleurochrysis_carterae.AAC.1